MNHEPLTVVYHMFSGLPCRIYGFVTKMQWYHSPICDMIMQVGL